MLGIPVFLHELGHFLAAKSVCIRVEKFYVGFDFFNLGVYAKFTLIVFMIVGRIELLTLFILLKKYLFKN